MIILTRKTRWLADRLRQQGMVNKTIDVMRPVPVLLPQEVQRWQSEAFDHVFVGSRLAGHLWGLAAPANHLANARFWAPGRATADWLRQYYANVECPSSPRNNAHNSAQVEGSAALHVPSSGRWLILTAEGGKSAKLSERVIDAHIAYLYRTIVDQRKLKQMADQGAALMIVTSQQAAKQLVALPNAQQHRYIVSSEHVASVLQQQGISDLSIAKGATEQALFNAIQQHV